MRNTAKIDKEQGPREALCPRCGAEADWPFAGEEQSLVEAVCPDCDRFEIRRAEFEQAESEIAARDERM